MRLRTALSITAIVAVLLVPAVVAAAAQITDEDSMVEPAPGWSAIPSFTVGESVDDYLPAGILDGIGAYRSRGNGVSRLFVNHELNGGDGYVYELANGTELTGARISWFDIQATTLKVVDAGAAYDTIFDVGGNEVIDPGQLRGGEGLRRFCSGRGVHADELGFVDDVYFAGEEVGDGLLYALDIAEGELWAVPAAGSLAWENVTPVQPPTEGTVALIIGDDAVGKPLWLYVGEKDAVGDGSFLDRNGLAVGTLHYWVSDEGYSDPQDFNGTGGAAGGEWVAIDPGTDVTDPQALLADAQSGDAFQFSRPEDVHDNPDDSSQVVLASTGRDTAFGGADSWGTVYLIDVAEASIEILYDGDDSGGGQFTAPQFGIRSPDNLTWAGDGRIYLQEDRAVSSALRPQWAEGGEAKVWSLDPASGAAGQVAQVDRSAVPAGQTDLDPDDVGDWETSGILDVTSLFKARRGETILVLDVQAHSLGGGTVATEDLVEGGQLLFLRG